MTEITQRMCLQGNQSTYSGPPFSVQSCTCYTRGIYGKSEGRNAEQPLFLKLAHCLPPQKLRRNRLPSGHLDE